MKWIVPDGETHSVARIGAGNYIVTTRKTEGSKGYVHEVDDSSVDAVLLKPVKTKGFWHRITSLFKR